MNKHVWTARSSKEGRQFLKVDKTEGIVDGASHIRVSTVRGKHKNEDILI